jgi:hypothetical protein
MESVHRKADPHTPPLEDPMSNFTRQSHITSWYGYARKATNPIAVRVAAGAEPVSKQVRPDVWVREFPSVKVKEIKVSDRAGRDGARSVSVVFDASSVVTGSDKAMKHDFAGSTVEGTPIHQALQQCLDQGRPVYIAIETKRRYKNAAGQVIPYIAPMHVLRGSNPDGTKGNSNTTGENCANVLAVVGPAEDPTTNIISSEAVTDPLEWDEFRHNRDGSMAPDGWVHVFDDDGQRAGAITRAETSLAPTAGIDAAQIAAEVARILSGGNDDAPTLRAARSVEGKPWEVRNSDGRINPAGYLPQSLRWIRKDALNMVQSAALADEATASTWDDDQWSTTVTNLIKPLLWAAERVQGRVLGYTRHTEPSFREASKWVAQVAAVEKPYQLAFATDLESAKGWIVQVADTAADLYRMALDIAEEIATAAQGPGVPAVDASRAGVRASQEQAQLQPPAAQERPAQQGPQPDPQPGPQGAPSPQENPAPTAQQTMLAQAPELAGRWDSLIERVGMAQYPDRLNPLLVRTFGTHLSNQIPAAAFATQLQQWEADPARFFETAKNAAQATAA